MHSDRILAALAKHHSRHIVFVRNVQESLIAFHLIGLDSFFQFR